MCVFVGVCDSLCKTVNEMLRVLLPSKGIGSFLNLLSTSFNDFSTFLRCSCVLISRGSVMRIAEILYSLESNTGIILTSYWGEAAAS